MTTKTMERLLSEMRRAAQLVDDRRAHEALPVYREIIAEARKVSLEIAHVHYAYAIACDYCGELEMAFEQIMIAVAKDPLSLPFRHSFEVVAGRIRAALADPERAADDASTPRLYALLQRAGAVDVAAHLAMARYLLATGKPADARALVDAVTLLHPTSREAWEAKAMVAAAAGDTATADQARLEAAALAAAEPPFAIFGPASA